jgi:hypothetical protein
MTITTNSGKGASLTHEELDVNIATINAKAERVVGMLLDCSETFSKLTITADTLIAAPTGAPFDGQLMQVGIVTQNDYVLSWDPIYRFFENVSSNIFGEVRLAMIYNAQDSKWDVVNCLNVISKELDSDFSMLIDTTLASGDPYIRISGTNPNVTIYWGDDTQDTYTTTGRKYHTYAAPGQYLIRITGYLESMSSSGYGFQWAVKIYSIGQDLGWKSFSRLFEMAAANAILPTTILPPNVTNLFACFYFNTTFNSPIGWNTVNVTNMNDTFSGTAVFNQPLNHLNVSNVTSMSYMFAYTEAFNQPLNNWNVSNVTSFSNMFWGSSFDQDLGMWPLRISGVNMGSMLNNCGMSPENYARTLIGWSNYVDTNANPINVTLGAANVEYGDTYVPGGTFFDAQGARDHLTATRGWTITDAGWQQVAPRGQSSELLRTYDTTLGDGTTTIVIPIGNQFNVYLTVYWGDGTSNTYESGDEKSHTYASHGQYLVRVRGTHASSTFDVNPIGRNNPKLIDFHSVGSIWFESIDGEFLSFRSLLANAVDFNQPIGMWDTSKVTNMDSLANHASSFNQPLNDWDVSLVTTLEFAFFNATAFNQDLGAWPLRIAGVSMSYMLDNCGMSTENYSRTLIGWANYVAANGGPINVTLGAANKTYNNTAYVTGQTYNNAAAARAYLTTSPSVPISWSATYLTGLQPNTIQDAEYHDGLWVAVQNNGNIGTATNSIGPYTLQTSSFDTSYISALAYGNGVWVAVGDSGKLATSTNGVDWTQRVSSFGTSFISDVAYGNGVWVAVGDSGKLATATDPTGTWTQRTSGHGTSSIQTVIYANGIWVATSVGNKLTRAVDPTGAWTLSNPGFFSAPNKIAYGNGVWVAVMNSGYLYTATTPEGTWTSRTSSFGTTAIYDVHYANSTWVAGGASGKIATATNPTGTWTQRTSGFNFDNIYSIKYILGSWSIFGSYGIVSKATVTHGPAWTITDGGQV